jgi:hypothetical protein
MVSLNSINYKSNQHQESFPYELDKIHPKMLHWDGMVMKVLVMMMMIPMKPRSMTMLMVTISPLRERIWDFYFCALGSLVVLNFPQPLSFSSVLPKPLSETLTRSSDGRNPI